MHQLYLHIGTHKTGTTSIQRFMEATRAELLADGVLYPRSGQLDEPPRMGHQLLASSVRGTRGYSDQEGWSELAEELRAADPAVAFVSSEDFSSCSASDVAQVRTLTSGYPTVVLVYLRNHLDYLVSQYKTWVKNPQVRYRLPFRRFCERHMDLCDYEAVLDRWQSEFGCSAVMVKVFDKVREPPGLLTDLLASLGLDPRSYEPHLGADMIRNVSPSDQIIEILRQLNHWERQLETGSDDPRDAIARLRRVARRERPLLDDDDVDWIRENTAEWRASFVARYVPPEDHRYFDF